MPSLPTLLAFAGAALLLIVVPGPSVLFVVSRGVALGRRAALATVAGNSIGELVQVVCVAAGIGVIVERSIVVFTVMKIAGAAYLVWLGVQAIRDRRQFTGLGAGGDTHRSRRSLIFDGFLVGVTNPKSIVFFAAILPQFVDPAGAPVAVQTAVLGLIFIAVALVSDSAWGLFAGTARAWFARSPRRLELLGGAGGLVMIGLGLRLAISGRKD